MVRPPPPFVTPTLCGTVRASRLGAKTVWAPGGSRKPLVRKESLYKEVLCKKRATLKGDAL